MLKAEREFRNTLKLPNTDDTGFLAASLILRAPRLLKSFEGGVDVKELVPKTTDFDKYTRKQCFDSIVSFLRDHLRSRENAKTRDYSKEDTSLRIKSCRARADLLLLWALRYDVATGPHVMFEHVALAASNAGNRKCCIPSYF